MQMKALGFQRKQDLLARECILCPVLSQLHLWLQKTHTPGRRIWAGLPNALSAASGTMVAGHAGMDILGCTMVGTITSLGGGTIRDLLLGRTPVFWFKEIEYLLLCVGTALAAFYAHDKLEGPVAEEALWWGDTLGIGAFSVVGAQAAARDRADHRTRELFPHRRGCGRQRNTDADCRRRRGDAALGQ